MLIYIASDTVSMASMASSERSTTPDHFGPNDYDPFLLPLGMFIHEFSYNFKFVQTYPSHNPVLKVKVLIVLTSSEIHALKTLFKVTVL